MKNINEMEVCPHGMPRSSCLECGKKNTAGLKESDTERCTHGKVPEDCDLCASKQALEETGEVA